MSSLPDQTTTQADLGAVVEAIRGADRFLVTTHENPDGDDEPDDRCAIGRVTVPVHDRRADDPDH